MAPCASLEHVADLYDNRCRKNQLLMISSRALKRLETTLMVPVVPISNCYDWPGVDDDHLVGKLFTKDVPGPLP
jgi:hypothetical protein